MGNLVTFDTLKTKIYISNTQHHFVSFIGKIPSQLQNQTAYIA